MPKPFFMSTFKNAVDRIMGDMGKKEKKEENGDVVRGKHILVVDDVRDALGSGMDAHIAKPVQTDDLRSTIGQVLDSRVKQPEGPEKAGNA